MIVDSKIRIQGKRSTITLDADAGGIWIEPRDADPMPGDVEPVCLCVISDKARGQYVGFYDGRAEPGLSACDVAIGMLPSGKAGVWLKDSDGKQRLLDAESLIRLLGDGD